MDVMIGAYGSSYLEEGAAHIVYGTNTSAAYEASFLDLGAADGGLDGIDGFTLTGIMMQFPIYAELVRQNLNTISLDKCTLPRRMGVAPTATDLPVCSLTLQVDIEYLPGTTTSSSPAHPNKKLRCGHRRHPMESTRHGSRNSILQRTH